MKNPAADREIQNILSRLARLERAVFNSASNRNNGETPKGKVTSGLPAHILKLRSQNFFRDPRTASEVRKKLESRYPCDHDRVAMALLRLQRRKQLRKSSKIINQKKQVAYVW